MNNFNLARLQSSQGSKSTGNSNSRGRHSTARTKKRTQTKSKRETTSPSVSKKSTSNWSKILSPKNVEESMTSISTLRNFCKQCVRYIQQADGLLDTLYVTTNSLKESGILKKLSESKGKNLNTADFTTLLLALMNTPLGNNFFKRMMGGDNSATETEAPPTETPKPATAAPSQAASTTPSTNQVRPGPQAQAALPPAQPRPPGNPYPPYGYPPGSMPM